MLKEDSKLRNNIYLDYELHYDAKTTNKKHVQDHIFKLNVILNKYLITLIPYYTFTSTPKVYICDL